MLAPWKEHYDKPKQRIKKERYNFADKCLSSQSMVFPVVMYGCESWTIKKTEWHRIDAFELWCWRRLLRVPWTARSSNQSVVKEVNPEYSLEGQMLKLQYPGHLMRRADSLEKTLLLGKIEGGRRRGRQRMRWLDGINGLEFEQTWGDREGRTGKPGVLQSIGSQRVQRDLSTGQQQILLYLLGNTYDSTGHMW